ncbi:CynX/NimT family MFS transporter [Microbacterium soli]|uniref:MFS transporter n=1 Tax=Microbacterium soli TaxID=446075 RepID=UPI0031CE19AA
MSGITLFAFSLRTAVASLSPLLHLIQRDLTVPATVIGVIGASPMVCYAAFGIMTPAWTRRFGLERMTVAVLGVTTLGLTLRACAPDAPTLLATTVLIFAALGTGNILTPALAKRYFPRHIGTVTTMYATMLSISTFLPPGVAVPLADAAGWRFSIGVWAVFALLALIPWVWQLIAQRGENADAIADVVSSRPLRRLGRLRVTWAITLGFTISSAIAYTGFSWLPTILIDRAGVTPDAAGALLALFGLVSLPCSLVVPLLVARMRAERVLFVGSCAPSALGCLGLLLAPSAAPWLWTALLGLGPPLLFSTTMALFGIRTRAHPTSVALSSFVQSFGYGSAAVFPLIAGILHDMTGHWDSTIWILAAASVLAIPAGIALGRQETLEEQWERRHGPWDSPQ